MVAHTPKWSLPVEETGDPSDMPAASGRLTRAIEQALDRLQQAVTDLVATSVEPKMNRAGDTMSGTLTVPDMRVSNNWSVSPAGGKFIVYRMSPNGQGIESMPLIVEYANGDVHLTGPTIGLHGAVFMDNLPQSPGGGDIAESTGAVMRMAGGGLKTFTRTAFALWMNLAPSTRRIKQNITPAAPTGVFDIEPVTFQYKPEVCEDHNATHLGVIAEQVAEVFPAAVIRDAQGQPEGVDVMALVAGLIAEGAALRARIETLEEGR